MVKITYYRHAVGSVYSWTPEHTAYRNLIIRHSSALRHSRIAALQDDDEGAFRMLAVAAAYRKERLLSCCLLNNDTPYLLGRGENGSYCF